MIMNIKHLENVTLIGMGALGTLFASILLESLPSASVTFLMDPERYEKYHNRPVLVNGTPVHFNMVTPDQAEPADLIIVSTKATGLEAALDTMETSVGPDTIIISAINGVTSEEILSRRFGREKVIHTVAQGMDAAFFSGKLTYKIRGCLCIGITDPSMQEKLDALTAFFDRTNFPYRVESDILHRIWSKFMLNVGINQVCMVCQTGYGGATRPGSFELMLMVSAMREAKLIALAEGISLTEEDLTGYVDLMRSLTPDSMPSMAQDRIRKKPSEVEIFSGTVRAIAEKHGILVPVNDYLYDKIKEIEAAY